MSTPRAKELTEEAVRHMDYSTLVGLIREENRPSGGIRTVHAVALNAFIGRDSRVLEIGSTTGFTSVNLSLLTGCSVVGIDLNRESIDVAEQKAIASGVADRVTFREADATRLPFDNTEFDLVWASNVTSFIQDKERAVREYLRVLAPRGFLALVPIYYRTTPPQEIVTQVGRVIGSPLRVWEKRDWTALCRTTAAASQQFIELVVEDDFEYLDRSEVLDEYCADVLAKPHLNDLQPGVLTAVRERYSEIMHLFNENLKYCGFSILLFQQRALEEEAELFVSRRVSHGS